jgi:cardiolipin synthase
MKLQIPRSIQRRFRGSKAHGPFRYVRRPDRLRRHTQIKPLRNGEEVFPEMLEAIRGARRTIHFETYILMADRIGEEFRDALVERAKAGVEVRFLYDGVGSIELKDSFLDPLRAAGGHVAIYHPVAPWRPRWGWNKRDHKKILVVDDRIGFTGGINLGLEYVCVEQGGKGWLDWHARVEGTAVHELAVSFRRTWIEASDVPIPVPEQPGPALGRNALGVMVVDNTAARSRWRMHRAYLHAITRAERDISILNSYFIPERSLRRAFRRAVARGVSVRVVMPSDSDVPPVRHASRYLYRRLLSSGVRIFEWRESMMHAKMGVIDGVWSTIGSYNLDHRSLVHNLEVCLVCVDQPLAAKLQAAFEKDLARCVEITLQDLDQLKPWDRIKDWFWYQLRSQL